MSAERDIRRIGSDDTDTIPARVLRDFLLHALRHEAISDVLIEWMVFEAEKGRLGTHSLARELPELIGEVLDAAAGEDWLAVAVALIEDMRESLPEETEL